MTARAAIEGVFLAAMLLGAALAVAGTMRARDALSGLHAVSFAGIVVPIALAGATLAGKAASESSAKALVFLAIAIVSAPITAHALGRAIVVRSER